MGKQSNMEVMPTLYWFLGSIWAPIALPFIIYKIIKKLYKKNLRTNLVDKVVLITGASSGLGEALAHAFYAAGCRVILAARRKDQLERVKKDLLAYNKTNSPHIPIVLELDLADIDALQQKVESILNICNNIDILVNNGGVSHRGDVFNTDVSVYQRIMLVNCFGQIALTRAVLPSMMKRKSGHIVSVSSVQGLIGIPYRSAYAASKFAAQAFYDSLRAEIASQNINVTVVSPGYIKTQLSINALTGTGTSYGKMDETTASGYEPEYVADKILDAVAEKKNEITVAQTTALIALHLRYLIPSMYFWIMEKKAKNAPK